ncbi:MAG: hypothetical protein JWO20_994 [Candidatus Angelobacter sp.]|nr:hypothetical protein [Candidatus Angelobacter sp.]
MTENPSGSIEDAKEILRSEVSRLKAESEQKKAELSELTRQLGIAERGLAGIEGTQYYSSTNYNVFPNQFFGKRLAMAIKEYLQSVGEREVHITELTEVLRQGSAEMGGDPDREETVVKIAVSTNKDMLSLRGKRMVSLKKRD